MKIPEQKSERIRRIEALRNRPGTEGERVAAEAAIQRIAAPPAKERKPERQWLTDAICKKLPAPAKGKQIYYNRDVANFGLRVTAAGARSFVLRYRRKADATERTLTIGSFPDWSAGAAREEAKRLKRLVDGGADPVGEQREQLQAPTVNDLADRFEAEHLPRKRASTQGDYRSILHCHIRPKLGKRKVAAVEFADANALHRAVTMHSGEYRANRVNAVLSAMMSNAMKWKWRADNPCKGVERNDEQKRTRYPTDAERVRLCKALDEHDDQDAADVFRLLDLTGARRGEVLAMRWPDVDLEKGVWVKPGSTTKQRTTHIVPLNAPARQLLVKRTRTRTDCEYVFPSRRKGHRIDVRADWVRVCKTAKITGLRIHDLRHGFASQLANSGASLQLIGALLGHSNVATTARYSHLLDSSLREATERVGALVSRVAS
jgi:integrase